MNLNNKKEIEDLITEFVNLNPVSDETRKFYKNRLTQDCLIINAAGESRTVQQLLMPDDLTIDIIFQKLDSIEKIVISPDNNLAFISFNVIFKFKVKGTWSEKLTFNIYSGYVVKENNIWKIGWIQSSQKELKS